MQPAELQICQDACRPGGLTVGEVGQEVLQPLYKQGLIYLSVPIQPSDHISIPPLEVRLHLSCATCPANGGTVEGLLYPHPLPPSP